MEKTPGNKIPHDTWHIYIWMWGLQSCRGQAFLPQLQFCMASLHPAKFTQGSLVLTIAGVWKTEEKNGVRVCNYPSSCIFFFNNLNRLDFSALIKKNLQKSTYIFQKYLEDVKTYFGAEPQSVNFIGSSDQIRKEINSWVEKQTEGKLSAR